MQQLGKRLLNWWSKYSKKMFETVGTSVAMGNANDKVKSIATYTTLSNEEDGIVHSLENIVNHLL